MKCEYCKDPEKAVTIFRKTAGKQHRVQAIFDASSAETCVTFSVVRLAGARTGRPRQFCTGFAVNYCPWCGRKLRTEDTSIEPVIKQEEK